MNAYFGIVAQSSAHQGTTFVGRPSVDLVDTLSDILNFHLQGGTHRSPDQPAAGVAEQYYRLMQALGKDMDHDSISLDLIRYSDGKTARAIKRSSLQRQVTRMRSLSSLSGMGQAKRPEDTAKRRDSDLNPSPAADVL